MGKECHKALYCHLAYLTCMASCEMPRWINHKLESRSPGEILTTLDIKMITTLMAESEKELKDLNDECERGEWKNWIETQCSKN